MGSGNAHPIVIALMILMHQRAMYSLPDGAASGMYCESQTVATAATSDRSDYRHFF